jgi:hypothetical protein
MHHEGERLRVDLVDDGIEARDLGFAIGCIPQNTKRRFRNRR